MTNQTVLVELSHPDSLGLLQELEHTKVIKLLTTSSSVDLSVPDWHKEIVLKRVANTKDTDFTELDVAFKKLIVE